MDIVEKVIEAHEESIRYCNERIKSYKIRIKHREELIKDLKHEKNTNKVLVGRKCNMKHTQPIYQPLKLIHTLKFNISYWYTLTERQRENILDDLGW